MPRNQRFESSDSSMDDWRSVVKKSVYTGAIGAVGAYLIYGERGSASFLEMQVPAAVAAGLGAGVGSVGSDLLSDWILEKVSDQSNEIKTAEGTAIKLGVAGASTVLALKYASGLDPTVEGFVLGAGSKFGGDAVHTQLDPLAMLF